MNRYPALKAVATLSKVVGVLVGLAIGGFGAIFGAMADEPFQVFISILVGAFVGLSIYVSGEFIQLLLDVVKLLGNIKESSQNIKESNQISTNAVVRMYTDSKRGDE
jgi:hypothetical protein